MGCLIRLFSSRRNHSNTIDSESFLSKDEYALKFINEGGSHFIEDSVSMEDFKRLTLLGRGTFGEVILVRHIQNRKIYAMKILKKKQIKETEQEIHTKTERILLEKINHPFIVKLFYAFQDITKLYLVTEFIQGGELFYHLAKARTFNAIRTKFYAAQIVLAFEYLHANHCIYRDLKPENILLGKDGYIKLTDFGLSKITLEKNSKKAYTICGTREYLAPEILTEKGYDKSVDWWSLGTLIFHMLSSHAPLKFDRNEPLNIDTYYQPIRFTNAFPDDAKNLLRQLLVINPAKRLGYGPDGTNNLKANEYFKDINWDDLYYKKIQAPFIPNIIDEMDLSNFDKTFTSQKIVQSSQKDNNGIIHSTEQEEEGGAQDDYLGFSFVKNAFEDSFDSQDYQIEMIIDKEG